MTTVPAAANVARGLAFGAWTRSGAAQSSCALNITGMAVAGWLTLAVQRAVWSRVRPPRSRASLGRRIHAEAAAGSPRRRRLAEKVGAGEAGADVARRGRGLDPGLDVGGVDAGPNGRVGLGSA